MLTELQQDTRERIAASSANAGATLSLNLDGQNPWPGLAAYDEVSRDFFHGRDREATELLRLIRLAPLTALYSKSGLGKSSLLQAGLFPLLRANHYLPVNLRLDYAEGTADSIFEGVKDRLVGELERAKAEFPPPGDESLWEYLHHKDIDIWAADNFPLTPVLVFDQFEELFNIRKPRRVDEIFDRLGDLIENRIPAELASDAAKAKRSKLDLGSQRYRIVLSFREDYLAEVQTWERRIPSLLRNYLRLEPMSRERAIEAVERSGADVLERDVAPIIVDFVGGQGAASSEAAATVIEPVLLSLCCYQLNRQRRGKKIDKVLVDRVGHDILDSFYRGALADEDAEGPPDVSAFIENSLIHGDHFRGTYPRTEALNEGLLTERQLAALTDRHRLLRVVPYADTQRIELIHDRLVPTVRKARDERQAREHQKAEAEDALRRTKARANRAITLLLAGLVFFACTSAIALYKLWIDAEQERAKAVVQSAKAEEKSDEADKQRAEADRQRAEADRQRAEADRQRGEADKQRGEADKQRAEAELARNTAMAAHQRAELARARLILEVARSKVLEGNGELASLLVVKAVRENMLGPDSPLWSRAMSVLTLGVSADRQRAVLLGHTHIITSVAFSPDGALILTASGDGTARVWDARNGAALVILKGHAGPITEANFSPDGKKIITASIDRTSRLWDAQTGKLITELKGHKDWVRAANFSPDGKNAVTVAEDDTAHVWDAQTGKLLMELKHKSWITAPSFSPDGKTIITVSEGGTSRVWNAQTGRLLAELKGKRDLIVLASFSPDGRKVLTGSDDGTVRVWDALTAKLLKERKQQHKGLITTASFSPNGQKIVTGSMDRTARVWDTQSGAESVFEGHQKSISMARFSPDGQRVVTASNENTARVWDVDTGESLAVLTGHTAAVVAASFDATGERIVTASYDGTARVWDGRLDNSVALLGGHKAKSSKLAVRRGEEWMLVTASADNNARVWHASSKDAPVLLKGHSNRVNTIAFSPDEQLIVTGSDDRTARIWHLRAGPTTTVLKGHEGPVTSAVISSNGTRIATASGTTLRLWNAVTGDLIAVKRNEHTKKVNAVAFSPDGTLLVSASDDGTVRFWDGMTGDAHGNLPNAGTARYSRAEDTSRPNPRAETETQPAEPAAEPARDPTSPERNGAVVAAIFSPDGSRMLTKSSDGAVRLWDVKERRLIKDFEGRAAPGDEETLRAADLGFSGDGKRIAMARAGNTARISDARTGNFVRDLEGHRGPINAIAFSSDGKTIVTGSDDRTALLWDADTGTVLAEFVGHRDSVTAVDFASVNGKQVVTGSADGTIRVWDAPDWHTADLMAYASVSALRELSTDERETILGDDKPAGWASVILGAGDDGEKCDRLAGNPFDRQKLIGQGVFLRDIEPEAVNVCDAASQAHPQEPRYLYQLGRALEKVKRIPEATDRYQRAADLGYARAFYNLGTMYKIGPKRDLKVAIDNYHKAWSLDVVTAAAQLASIFLNGGEGVSADPQKALEWLHLGIKAGDSNSHREIALLHQKGDHVKRNLEMALFHHIIAMLIFEGQRNPEFSKHEVGSLARSLPKADVLRIDREARDWLAARPKTLP